ncbi:MAG TPA: hypothetical protein DCR45_03085 [Gammaproteobacteria bacterium]|nr:hypothetical protein [Gammaproteobacteria bacterium]
MQHKLKRIGLVRIIVFWHIQHVRIFCAFRIDTLPQLFTSWHIGIVRWPSLEQGHQFFDTSLARQDFIYQRGSCRRRIGAPKLSDNSFTQFR